MNDLKARFTSRKFLLAVFGVIVVVVLPRVHIVLSNVELAAITTMVAAFIGMEGAADIVTRRTNIPPVDEEAQS